nr:hypothetical protein [Tessaracoccus coleopterorum]
MKAPISWLRDNVTLPSDVDTARLADQFTRVGLTVEHIETTGSPVTGPLVVGRVASLVDEPQKNGKVIRYCRVDVGAELNDPATDEVPASRASSAARTTSTRATSSWWHSRRGAAR